jgi:calcineurin-like phosphoesterase family protein
MAEMAVQNTFLIEIRLTRTKWRIKRNTEQISRIFSLDAYCEKHPHVTLFGPFSLKPEVTVPDLLKTIESIAQPFGPIPFVIDGYEMNQGLNGAVIAYRVVPADPLTELTEAVSEGVSRLAGTVNVWDTDPDQKWYHITIANRLDRSSGATIFRQLENQEPVPVTDDTRATGILGGIRNVFAKKKEETAIPPVPPLLDEDGLRITVISGDHIIAEYDLLQHRFFPAGAPGAAAEWQRTLRLFRIHNGLELQKPRYSSSPDIYLISDLHLGHGNIIRYCSRPFPHGATDEMDEVLIRNWNYTVKAGDPIYHLGDFCYGPFSGRAFEYARRLNGKITFVEGNHDNPSATAKRKETLVFEGIRFTLVHDPADASPVPGNWVIHGHHHNNHLREYPFINFATRHINVCAEVIGYRPVSLSAICHAIKEQQVRPKIKSILLREQ